MKKYMYFIAGLFLIATLSSFVPDNPEKDPLSVFPNPAREFVNIHLNIELPGEAPEISILDLTGKPVSSINEEFTFENEHYRMRLDISDLKPGIYFIKVTADKETFSKKLLIR